MKFRTLTIDDAPALLEFELANRAWFEKTVLKREDSVYTVDGIGRHVQACLDDLARGTMHPNLMLDEDGRIAGRVNLKDIDVQAAIAEVGYRIAQKYVGQGWATASLRHLLMLAYEKWDLQSLQAFVTTENPASARVLDKCGFVRREFIPQKSLIQGRLLDGYRYLHRRS
ncbi:MAG TPA: GNAT family N-acetyltransferase [Burkholderiaceae bacterium]|jgi:ribosomal-protein-alanine N-acetyltransferase